MGDLVQAFLVDILGPYRSLGSVTVDLVKTEAALSVVRLRRSATRTIALFACGVAALYLIGFGLSLSLLGGLILMAIEFNSKTASIASVSIGAVVVLIGVITLFIVIKGWNGNGTSHTKTASSESVFAQDLNDKI